MKSYVVHLKNKYPDATVLATETSIDVHGKKGEHLVAMRLDGSGSWLDQSAAMGLPGRFDLAPIPKAARVHKLKKDGTMGFDELAEERKAARAKFIDEKTGAVKSIEELKAEGTKFDDAGNVLS